MTNANYGKLYYAVSRMAISTETLNKAGSSKKKLTLDILIFVRDMTGAFYMMQSIRWLCGVRKIW